MGRLEGPSRATLPTLSKPELRLHRDLAIIDNGSPGDLIVFDTHKMTRSMQTGREGQAESGLQPGATLQNRYLIQGVLGVGGMGSVYRARDMRFPNVTKVVAV